MHPALLRNLAARGPHIGRLLAQDVLEGNSRSCWPLHDWLLDEDVRMTGLEVGKAYYVETVTKYYVGELVAVDFTGLVLVRAAWIPDTGRFHEAFESGQFGEVEPLPEKTRLFIPAAVLSGVVEWKHPVPREVK